MSSAIAPGGMRKVAIVTGVCVKYDAISASVRDDARALSENCGFHSRVFAYHNELSDIDATEIQDASQLVLDEYFLSCDLIIYHFGIFYELFNAIFVGNGRAPQAVRYHNLTPREFLPRSEWAKFERSAGQLYNLAAADAVWPVSEINRRDVLGKGLVAAERVNLIPLCVGDGRGGARPSDKEEGVLQLLFVGRMVRAKGLLDLLQAAMILRQNGFDFSLRIVGDMRFSQEDYVEELQSVAKGAGFGSAVTFIGRVGDDELEAEYRRAHILVIPSYHEGFCKPVVEALRYGCVAVTYHSGNLAYVARGFSRTVPAGEVATLAEAITEVGRSLRPVLAHSRSGILPLDRGDTTLGDYERGVAKLLREYGFPAVSRQLGRAAQELIERTDPASLRLTEWGRTLEAEARSR